MFKNFTSVNEIIDQYSFNNNALKNKIFSKDLANYNFEFYKSENNNYIENLTLINECKIKIDILINNKLLNNLKSTNIYEY